MDLDRGARILKSKRVLLGITQVEIARKLGITEKSYNMKENGKVSFTLFQIRGVSRILALTLDEVDEVFLHLKSNNH
ncbi:MAG: helix-turn-helix transcriptional regulator [Paraclostridium sp.]